MPVNSWNASIPGGGSIRQEKNLSAKIFADAADQVVFADGL